MIKLEKESLSNYTEKDIINNYYLFYGKLHNELLIPGLINFKAYKEAINTINSINEDNIEFMCYLKNEKDLIALARLKVIPNDSIQIAEIIFLDKKDPIVKTRIVLDFLEEVNNYATELNCKTVYYEIPKKDEISNKVASYKGFELYDELQLDDRHATILYCKEVQRENENESTYSRKQTKE